MMLQAAKSVNDKMIVAYGVDANDKLLVFDFGSDSSPQAKLLHQVELPSVGSIGKLDGNKDENNLLFSFSSFSRPDSLFKLNLETYKTETVFMQKMGNLDYNFDDYISEQVFYTSKDGTKVPMFITRKKTTLPDLSQAPEKPIPVMMYGYGGFGSQIQPSFNPAIMPMLDNLGAMYVVANIRGGDEYGERWH